MQNYKSDAAACVTFRWEAEILPWGHQRGERTPLPAGDAAQAPLRSSMLFPVSRPSMLRLVPSASQSSQVAVCIPPRMHPDPNPPWPTGKRRSCSIGARWQDDFVLKAVCVVHEDWEDRDMASLKCFTTVLWPSPLHPSRTSFLRLWNHLQQDSQSGHGSMAVCLIKWSTYVIAADVSSFTASDEAGCSGTGDNTFGCSQVYTECCDWQTERRRVFCPNLIAHSLAMSPDRRPSCILLSSKWCRSLARSFPSSPPPFSRAVSSDMTVFWPDLMSEGTVLLQALISSVQTHKQHCQPPLAIALSVSVTPPHAPWKFLWQELHVMQNSAPLLSKQTAQRERLLFPLSSSFDSGVGTSSTTHSLEVRQLTASSLNLPATFPSRSVAAPLIMASLDWSPSALSRRTQNTWERRKKRMNWTYRMTWLQ